MNNKHVMICESYNRWNRMMAECANVSIITSSSISSTLLKWKMIKLFFRFTFILSSLRQRLVFIFREENNGIKQHHDLSYTESLNIIGQALIILVLVCSF